jgi:GxxExxY protein
MNENTGSQAGRKEPDSETDQLAREVIGAALEVHTVLGPGFFESIYEEALCVEMQIRGIPFVRQPAIAVNYKGRTVGEGRMDLLVGGKLVVELKAVESLNALHMAQALSYLKAMGFGLGLLINFNELALRNGIKRVVLS